jgi:TP901 family phage tail tape measure protein
LTQIGTAYVEVKGDLTQLQADVASALAPAKLGKFGKVAGVAMGGALAAGVGAAIAGKIAYDLGAEFDAAFDKIRINTGKTGKPLEKLKKDFKAVFASVPTDADTAADAISNLNKRLDLSGKPLRALSKNMLELSRMTETDLTGNIQSITRLFGDWSVSTAGQVPTLNKLWRASQKTGVNIKDLSDLMVQFGSPLRNLGFDFDTAAAMFSKFEKEGVNIQTAMPGLRMALKNFASDGKDPQKALEATFKAIDKAGSVAEANTIAFEVFGTRAGPDLAAAVREGRFEFDNIERSMRKGKDTIMRSSKDTRDLGENMRVLGNKLKVVFEPLGTLVFNTVGKISEALAGLPIRKWSNDVQRFVKYNEDFKDVLDAVRVALRVLGAVSKVAWGIMKDQFKAAWGYLKSGLLALKGLVKIVSGVFTGDWRKAWSGVKDLFRGSVGIVLNVMRGMTAPMRAVTKLVAKGIASAFEWGWSKVENIFKGGANAVISVVNKIIDAINVIPGVPDIDNIDKIGGSDSSYSPSKQGLPQGRQRGGPIFGGKPSGDSVPALLERGEYVLNREAVKTVGVENLDHLNFRKARRFQKGGPIGLSVGGAISDVAGMAADGLKNLPGGGLADMAGKALGKGAGWFVGQLPKPNLPVPFTDLGPYLIDQVTEWIKSHAPNVGGALGSMPGDLGKAMALAQQHGLSITSTTGGTHAPGSYHYSGRAFDASNGTNTPEERSYFLDAASRWGGKMLELFYDPIGWYIKNGSKVPGAIGGHSDHVHTAMQRGGFVGLMRGGAAEHGVVRNVGRFLLDRGFDFRATAGILGNAWREGLWNPSQMEFSGASNGGLYGFTTSPVSLEDLKSFAARRGKPWDDEIVQTNFMLSHGSPTGMAIRGALNGLDTIPETTEYFMSNWERPLASAAGLSERIGAAYDASDILRDAGIVRAGDDGGRESKRDRRVAQSKARREAREKQVKALIRKAFTADSPVAKKGALWQILDLYAQFGEFGSIRGGVLAGGAAPGGRSSEKARLLERAGQILSLIHI